MAWAHRRKCKLFLHDYPVKFCTHVSIQGIPGPNGEKGDIGDRGPPVSY